MATKKIIQELADKHNIRVAFEFGTYDGEFGGETRLTLPNGLVRDDGSTGLTIYAEGSTYSTYLREVMRDLKDLISEL